MEISDRKDDQQLSKSQKEIARSSKLSNRFEALDEFGDRVA
jgi:hypothetical protein